MRLEAFDGSQHLGKQSEPCLSLDVALFLTHTRAQRTRVR